MKITRENLLYMREKKKTKQNRISIFSLHLQKSTEISGCFRIDFLFSHPILFGGASNA